ncbi:hypothetical protein SAMD00019534_047400 [Acytostelium subglobosum LB1]|uniref:hypothetical protein n=1 Tax=Acytostelium subglobosum LB1 TaxID=1410327 RepID=UPI000644FA36|nr:hypothetical protein SAMD00019534_047400 [Acytostelium subglobosum LB1]GAM21565.1 hypothetical protein SAMD00019534_047400 [Acytostelium subglobosum LB1]|eukprot:XP_012755684.1 hypothetical protein SAMD00019534_047400 [Acytostelium subglobosum LB1]
MNAIKSLVQSANTYTLDNNQGVLCVANLPLHIRDEPWLDYRGLLIDTGRYYFDVDFIKSIIRGMSLLKLNALHWHITDDQSFPLEVPKYPNLHGNGAGHLGFIHNNITYNPKFRYYNHEDIIDIVEYARVHGVRVIPEVDMPAHARSWGLGYNITAQCPNYVRSRHNNLNLDYTVNLPLDISKQETYDVIQQVLSTLALLFPDPYVHIGGDEVPLDCWREDSNMSKRMLDLGYVDSSTYLSYYYKRMFPLIRSTFDTAASTPGKKKVIIWEDSFQDVVTSLDCKECVYQVWKGPKELENIQNSNKPVIYSYGHYLDPSYQSCRHFKDCYEGATILDKNKIIGVEACAWEMTQRRSRSTEKDASVVERGFDQRVWHRLIAIAERLWSGQEPLSNNTIDRAVAMARLLQRQGVDTSSSSQTIKRITNNQKEYN